MSDEPPVWKASDRKASLRRRAEWLNEEARRTFLSDKFHTELFLLFRADGQSGIVQPPPKIDRDVFVGASEACADSRHQPCNKNRVFFVTSQEGYSWRRLNIALSAG